ncbi:hypothetical protein [Nocardia sp. NPDC057668]|uniref:hypothetical protein n=1 Tax=Nocardia sp. NPDC057668 TaxID=3346202 RepID=UPI00366AF5A5
MEQHARPPTVLHETPVSDDVEVALGVGDGDVEEFGGGDLSVSTAVALSSISHGCAVTSGSIMPASPIRLIRSGSASMR